MTELEPRRSTLVSWTNTVDDHGEVSEQEATELPPTSPRHNIGERSLVETAQISALDGLEIKPADRPIGKRLKTDVRWSFFESDQLVSEDADDESTEDGGPVIQWRKIEKRKRRDAFIYSNRVAQTPLVRARHAAYDSCLSDVDTVHSASLRSPQFSMPLPNMPATSQLPETSDESVNVEMLEASDGSYTDVSVVSDASVETIRARPAAGNEHQSVGEPVHISNLQLTQFSVNRKNIQTALRISSASDYSVDPEEEIEL